MSDPNAGRAAPQPTSRPGFRFTPKQKAGLWILGAGAVVGLAIWKNPQNSDPTKPGPQQEEIRRVVEFSQPPLPREAAPPVVPVVAKPPAPPLPPATGSFVQGTQTSDDAGSQPKPKRMLSFATTTPPSPAGAAASLPAGGPPAMAGAGRQQATTVAFPGTTITGGRAGPAIDTTLALMPGIYGCTLDSAVDSERPGPFFCHTTRDIRSQDGVVLMERGTRIVGTYKSEVGQGQGRILSLAATAWTPQGVPVPLGAQVGDALGRVGMDGAVDTHFWPRMQTAVVLLLTRGALQTAQTALQAALQNGGTSINISGATGIEQAIADSMRGTQGIQNTVRKNQGEEIAFMVTAPISFADAYQVLPR